MPMNKPDIEQMQRAVATSLHEHWVLFLVEGIILVILGLAAIVIPPIATLAVDILFGWLFLISGLIGLITTFRMRHAPGFWWSLVSGDPWNSGRCHATVAADHRRPLAYHGGHRVLHDRRRCLDNVRARTQARIVGTMGLDAGERYRRPDLGRFRFRRPASAAAWAIGLLVGIDMGFGGSALIAMALHAREIDPRSAGMADYFSAAYRVTL